MLKFNIEDLKVDFVVSVYESVTKQIQQMDIKISILLSWNGLIAVMLGRLITTMVSEQKLSALTILLAVIVVITLFITGIFCFRVLKPRKGAMEDGFAGLLYSGDIMKLGEKNEDRIQAYLDNLLKIDTHEMLYSQFVKSIVLISEINQYKNNLFLRGLISTVICFSALVALLSLVGIKGQ